MISLLVPTRGRPANVRRLLGTAMDTAAAYPEFVFRTDEDDPAPLPAELAALAGGEEHVQVIRGPRDTLSDLWNQAAAKARGDILMQCDDEVAFRTEGWDALVEAAFAAVPDRIAFVHGRDGYQPAGTFGALGFLHRRWVDAVGYFTPPYFSCDYGDTWLNDVANALGRRVYLDGLLTEHMHPIAGKGEWDATHMDRLERGRRDGVAWRYDQLAPQRAADADKLRAVMNGATGQG